MRTMCFAVISAKIQEPVISGVDKFAPVGVVPSGCGLIICQGATFAQPYGRRQAGGAGPDFLKKNLCLNLI